MHHIDVPPAPPDEEPLEHVCRVLASLEEVQALCSAFERHVKKLVREQGLARWSCCVELCPESIAGTDFAERSAAQVVHLDSVRLHAHVFLEGSAAFSLSGRCRSLLFRGSIPYIGEASFVDQGGRGRGHKTAMAAGLYYCQAPKLTRVWGSHMQWVHATVGLKAEWVTAYWSQKKMSHPAAIREYIHVRRDAKRHIQNVLDVRAFSRQQDLARRAAVIRQRLAASKAPRRQLPQVEEEFLPQFADESLHRRKFLVLDGGSGFGRTEFARSLARSSESFIELTCSNTEHVDLRAFSPDAHDVIIWDECPPSLVLKFKKLFQGQAAEVMLGQTNTSQHAYSVFVYNVKMVVCSNLWQLQLRLLPREDAEWLEKNSIYVHVTAPLWRLHDGGD